MIDRRGASGLALITVVALSGCSSHSSGVELRGSDLGVVKIGAPFEDAVSKISTVLGEPTSDPATGRLCPGSSREVAWRQLRIGEQGGLLFGWVSTSGDLRSNLGIGVGSRESDLQEAYGDKVALLPATTGVNSFSIEKLGLAGNIDASGIVSALFSGGCGA
ncbi:hypothetical protein [Sporichthya polymorpha]|uniref:hypothetical protein n=1 Tax=Sporichthya polymorpha TaxID=35751 RepID=UPI0003746B8D|nr:hypothetical protein [Sporichthya polymorpha]